MEKCNNCLRVFKVNKEMECGRSTDAGAMPNSMNFLSRVFSFVFVAMFFRFCF